MPTDIEFNNANITNYEDIPSSRYPTLHGGGISQATVGHLTAQVSSGIVPDASGVFVKWRYPTSDNNFIRAAVGYQFQVIEGTFSSSDSQAQLPPGPLAYETISNFKTAGQPEERYINLQNGADGRVDIPSAILVSGGNYTARVRALLFSELGSGTVENQYFKYTEWASVSFRINSIPSAANLRVNGELNPTSLPSRDDIAFSFSFLDDDGPQYLYRVQVGTVPGASFSPNIWDSGLISGGRNLGNKDFEVPYTGSPLSPSVTLAWRVQVQDGLADGGFTSATNTFKINSKPTVSSLKVDGEELLFGASPIMPDTGLQVSWEFFDEDGGTQRAYNVAINVLSLGDQGDNTEAFEILNTGNVFSSSSTVSIPDLPQDSLIEIRLKVRDQTEFGDDVIGRFVANARPQALDMRVDGKQTPGDIASTSPTFSWVFFDETTGDFQNSFRVQVSANDTFATLLWDSGDVVSAVNNVVYGSTPSPIVPPVPLSHGSYFFVRVSVSDGISDSDFANSFFAINQRPNSPILLSPSSGSFSGILDVTWTPGSPLDADGDTVTYSLELTARRSTNQGWEYLAGPFDSSTVSFELDLNQIKAGNDYGIRVIANDGFADSIPTAGTSPVNSLGLGFTVLNHPPTTPSFLSPVASFVAAFSLKTEWIEGVPVDIDGDNVFYVLEITGNASATDPTFEKIGVFGQGATKAIIDISEYPDGSDYKLRLVAQDDKGGAGEERFSGIFSIINTASATDFEKIGNSLYISTSDGRIFRATESIWQVDESFDEETPRFEKFVSGNPVAGIEGGKLSIKSPPGSTYILRIGA